MPQNLQRNERDGRPVCTVTNDIFFKIFYKYELNLFIIFLFIKQTIKSVDILQHKEVTFVKYCDVAESVFICSSEWRQLIQNVLIYMALVSETVITVSHLQLLTI